MKRYKLKRDLPTFKAGDIFTLSGDGCLYKKIGEQISICVYTKPTLEEFPNILTDWFEEIPEEPKTVRDLKDGDRFYSISSDGFVTTETYHLETQYDDDMRVTLGNAFLTKKDAEKELARRRAKVILERDTKGFKVSRNIGNFYYVSYDIYDDSFDIGYWYTDDRGGELTCAINFATREDAQASIKTHEKEWKTYLGVEE